MKGVDQTARLLLMFGITFLPLVPVCAQTLDPTTVDPSTEDAVCVEKNYRHKTASELDRMPPEQLIAEVNKEWNYHVKLMDEYGMFTIGTYTEKIGVAIIPVLTRLAKDFASRPSSKCQQDRFFTAFAIAADVDNRIVRLRTRKDGLEAISAAAESLERMRAAGLADQNSYPYNKHPFGKFLLDQVRGANEHDRLMRELLQEEFGLRLSDKEFSGFVNFLTSTDPTYPSWTPHVDGSRNLRPNKKKYHDAYRQFKKTVATSNLLSQRLSEPKPQGPTPAK